jgi:hypothetical protein
MLLVLFTIENIFCLTGINEDDGSEDVDAMA